MPEYEKIATISSPSTTTSLSLEILEDASKKKLVGELIWFEYMQEAKKQYVLGQITEIELENTMLEISEIRSIARQRGNVNPISGLQDTHKGYMSTGAVFSENDNFEPSILGTVPPTGTTIYKADEDLLSKLLEQYKQKIFYLGKFYESELKLPLWFHHFGKPEDGGAGEAYHIGIYGMTGSGKSTLAKMIMLGYARHPQMAIFVFDPSGEFTISSEGKQGSELFNLNMKSTLEGLNKIIITKSVKDIVLDRWDLFEEMLFESDFFTRLTVKKGDNRRTACDILKTKLKDKIKLTDLHLRESFEKALTILKDENIQEQIYLSSAPRKRFADAVSNPSIELYDNNWKKFTNLFNKEGKIEVGKLVEDTFRESSERPIVIINLSKEEIPENMLWSDEIKAILINRIVNELKRRGEEEYKKGRFLNTLVILDEAQRIVPLEKFGEGKQDKMRSNIIDAVETTRKYGLGWMFLSLSLSTLHKAIYHENRISFYGFGLSSGAELTKLSELISDSNSIKLYQSFKDPHSVIDIKFRKYSFMTRGPVSPLSFSGNPLFLTMFNSPELFLKENNIDRKITKTRVF